MKGDLSMVALINVVFLLMVFFIFVGTMNPRDSSILPPKIADKLTEATPQAVEVSLNKLGELTCDGERLARAEQLAACIGDAEVMNVRADGEVTGGKFYQLIELFKGKKIHLTVRSG